MKLNKKGLTIIELIVSIALISVIMLFMYKLLSDITFERDNDYIATLNHEQRIEIIDNIESVLNDNNAGITSYSATGKTLRITYNGSSRSVVSVISGNKTLVLYNINGSVKNRWNIKGGTLGTISCESESYLEDTLLSCHIPIYTTSVDNKVNNNNTLDDIYFSVMY